MDGREGDWREGLAGVVDSGVASVIGIYRHPSVIRIRLIETERGAVV
ncbi:MAG: hypothetical protein HOC74_21565 [Gemmatimonadetes bacterium]|jgi:hypothetical protein|nr:hypothetical protein [Gemmatimonadota bacterium]